MDLLVNPYAPGAGTKPPELAGRSPLLERANVSLQRIRLGRPAKSMLIIGLRGVGKTVLLRRIQADAESSDLVTVEIEAPEGRSLPGVLLPPLRGALHRLSGVAQAFDLAWRALRAVSGFVAAFKLRYEDLEVQLDVEPEAGLADAGDLDHDLQALLRAAGEAARAAETALVIVVDELQYVRADELAPLITALHRCAQHDLPVTLVGAGLPQLRARTGRAKSYAERLFDFVEVGPLDPADARAAIEIPAIAEGVTFAPGAIDKVLELTHCYPYFLQEWGKHVWDVAEASPITVKDVALATEVAIASLDQSFFRVRFDRLTPSEKRYLRAMASLGPGPHRSGEVAAVLGRKVETFGPVRARLIDKGMIWSPSHGDTAFTVPLFDEFLRRVMPGDAWRNA
jgi:hypothetical protein